MAVTLNAKYLEPFVKQGELEAIFPQVQAAHHTIHERSGPGNDFLGWLDLRSIMTGRSLQGFKRQRKRYAAIPKS